jgi:hypothetical protein
MQNKHSKAKINQIEKNQSHRMTGFKGYFKFWLSWTVTAFCVSTCNTTTLATSKRIRRHNGISKKQEQLFVFLNDILIVVVSTVNRLPKLAGSEHLLPSRQNQQCSKGTKDKIIIYQMQLRIVMNIHPI